MGTDAPFTFTDWLEGEPNNALLNEKCIEIRFSKDVYKWNDSQCSRKVYFICEERISKINRNNLSHTHDKITCKLINSRCFAGWRVFPFFLEWSNRNKLKLTTKWMENDYRRILTYNVWILMLIVHYNIRKNLKAPYQFSIHSSLYLMIMPYKAMV